MKVMGFEHIFEKAVQFKLKPGGNLEKILLSAENKSNVYILSLWLISFSLSPPPTKVLVRGLDCVGKRSTVVSGLKSPPLRFISYLETIFG